MSKDLDEKLLLDHEYDGIQEYNNPLPNWWLFTFYITVIFTPIYLYYYHMGGGGLSLTEELAQDMAKIQKQQKVVEAAAPKATNETLSALMADGEAIKAGAQVYKSYCVACHGDQGQGGIGPNLTDNYWIHGDGNLEKVYEVVTKGVAEKGMPAWKASLKPDQIQKVTAFVGTMKGKNIEGKKPEGELYE